VRECVCGAYVTRTSGGGYSVVTRALPTDTAITAFPMKCSGLPAGILAAELSAPFTSHSVARWLAKRGLPSDATDRIF